MFADSVCPLFSLVISNVDSAASDEHAGSLLIDGAISRFKLNDSGSSAARRSVKHVVRN